VTAVIVQGDARRLPLHDASVDLIVTSPPYFALRSYQDGGEHYAGQIGSEATPAEFLEALWACTTEWMRVLKPAGSMWVNLGDKYSQRVALRRSSHQDGLFPGRPELAKDWKRDRAAGLARMPYENVTHPSTGQYVPEKSLMGLPWRYALGCIDHLGLILRAELVWSKPNGLPESVTDRVRRSHEQWFHLVKQPRYYSAVDEIREAYDAGTTARYRNGYKQDPSDVARIGKGYDWSDAGPGQLQTNPLGKLPGSVWEIPTEPLTVPDHLGVDHFAAFPTEWPRRLILGWSPPGICVQCEQGRRPVADVRYLSQGDRFAGGTLQAGRHRSGMRMGDGSLVNITGYACACSTPGAPTRPSVILDPFGGTGTTALVASALGRVGISVDLSMDYGRLAAWRTRDPAQRARAMRVEKPPVQIVGQADLFTQDVS
jgi:DNA modification methylase